MIGLKMCTVFPKIPEEMEEFTIMLLNATGGAKVGNKTTATLRISRNDDPIYFAGRTATIFDSVYIFLSLTTGVF